MIDHLMIPYKIKSHTLNISFTLFIDFSLSQQQMTALIEETGMT